MMDTESSQISGGFVPKALVVLAEGFEEMEAIAPIDLLRRAGVEVSVAGLSGLAVKSSRGLSVTAETLLERAGGEWDALVLPGGPGAKHLAASEPLKKLILELHRKGRWICAICASPALVLAPLGVLKGRAATCFRGMEGSLGPDARFLEQPVVVDGNVITGRGPAAAVAFALAIVEKICGPEEERKVRTAILF
jgi:4-methyl-5(b-hydroxyethyl)-thiazole monophosphate biosynthesis